MGETAADYLNVQMGRAGLTMTSLIMAGVLALALAWQFAQKRYVPASYWLAAVVLISIVGTLVTDNLVDTFHVPLIASVSILSRNCIGGNIRAMVPDLKVHCRSHSIFTNRREAYYWLAILFNFALGTAAGDLVAEKFALGYLSTGVNCSE